MVGYGSDLMMVRWGVVRPLGGAKGYHGDQLGDGGATLGHRDGTSPYGTPGGQTNTGREEMRNERGREGHTGGLRVTRKEEMGLGGKDIRRGEEKMTGIIVAA